MYGPLAMSPIGLYQSPWPICSAVRSWQARPLNYFSRFPLGSLATVRVTQTGTYFPQISNAYVYPEVCMHSCNHCWIIGTSSSFRSVFTCPLLNVPSPDVPLPKYTPLLTLPHALLTFSYVSCFLFFHCAHHFKWARKSRGRQV